MLVSCMLVFRKLSDWGDCFLGCLQPGGERQVMICCHTQAPRAASVLACFIATPFCGVVAVAPGAPGQCYTFLHLGKLGTI